LEVVDAVAMETGSYASSRGVRDLALAGQAVLLAGKKGVEIVDVSNPQHPLRLSRLRLGGTVQAIEIMDRYAWVVRTMRPRGIVSIDISHPEDPVIAGKSGAHWGMARDLAVRSTTGFVAEGLFGVGVYDFSNPQAPERLGRFDTPGITIHVALYGDLLAAADLFGPVRLYSLSDPLQPRLVSEIQTQHAVVDTALHGNALHLQALRPRPASWIKCLVGVECRPGERIEVYDISMEGSPPKMGDYLMEVGSGDVPLVGTAVMGVNIVVPEHRGFRVLEARIVGGQP
jgi:hypothetical protein